MFGEQTTTILMAAGMALAGAVLLRASWRRRMAAEGKSPAQKVVTRDHSLSDAPPELMRWQVEMHETARDLKAELDSKLAALQALVALARHERALLEITIARAQGEDIDPPTSTLAAIESLGDATAVDDPQRLVEVAAQVPLAGELAPNLFARDRGSLRVGRLADQGLAPAAIAEHLQLPLGEVELLLSLRAS